MSSLYQGGGDRESGAVWMLPIDLDIPLLLYNEENCRENGVEAEELTDFKQLVEAADHFYETPELREWYSLNGYQMRQAAVDKFNEGYIRRSGEVVYDTPVFEELCELFKEYRPGEKESLSTDMTQLSAMLGDEEGYYAALIY